MASPIEPDKTIPVPPPVKPPHNETHAPDQSPTTGEFTAAPDSDEFPATIGIYKIEKLLGEGGMGSVYLAEDPSLQRKVALKVMKANFAANPVARERFVREARAAAKVESDHIIRVYAVGENRGMPFIAMEYLKGKPMDVWMKESKASIKQILRIGYESALGLHAAHKAGLIHRDIKPANLWLEMPTGRIKILDFGLARPAEEAVHLTQSGVVVGTPAYMSPEQGRGKELDHRTDIFSLGCVLYHLSTGRRPFHGSNTYEIIASLIADTPTPPHEVNPNVPPALSAAIMQMLEKDAAKRPATARTIAEEMAKILKSLNQPKDFVPLPAAVPMNPTPMATNTAPTTAWENLDDTGSEVIAVNSMAEPVKVPKIVKVKSPRHSKMMWIIGSTVALLFVLLGSEVLLNQVLNKPKELGEEPPSPRAKPTAVMAVVPPVTTPATKPTTKPPSPVEPVGTLPPDLAKLKGGEEREFEIADGVKMVFCWIPPGKATLGSPATEKYRKNDEVEHEYTSKGYWLGKYPVTQQEYQAVISKNPSYFTPGREKMKAEGIIDTSRFPVEWVSWDDCQEFCKRMNVRTGIEKVFPVPGKFVLPHEDDWEYACRGSKGNSQPFYWGNALNGTQSNCRGTEPYGTNEPGPFLDRKTEVGAYAKVAPHPWGLCDMAGNVRNWCDNLHTTDPKYIVRGGHHYLPPQYCRSASRYGYEPTHRDDSHGFRVAFIPDSIQATPPLDLAKVTPAELAKFKGGEEADYEIANGVKMVFCWIPPGKATLGSPATEVGRRGNEILHEYTSKGYWLGKYPVTQGEYEVVMGQNPSSFAKSGKDRDKVEGIDTSRFPVETVSWDDCQNYMKKLNARSTFAGKFILPHEDEWEYGCRGGKGNFQPFYWGDSLNGTQSNCNGTEPYGTSEPGPYLGRTTEVGAYANIAPHPWGLCDMAGNVRNWCNNLYGTNAKYVVRGGYCSQVARFCRTADRYDWVPTFRDRHHGFRVAFIPDLVPGKPAVASGNPPLDPEWVKRVSALPVQEQFEEVKKEIIRRNPGIGLGEIQWEFKNKKKWVCYSAKLKDVEALRVLPLEEVELPWEVLMTNLSVIQSLRPTLKSIYNKSAEEFWKSVGK